jgi:biopolymer transport protein ExbB
MYRTRLKGGMLAFAVILLGLGPGTPALAAAPAENPTFELLNRKAGQLTARALAWYRQTPAADRVTWAGLGASAFLGLMVLAERSVRLRRRRIAPADFMTRFLDRLRDGKLDRGKALDLCELNTSPASRIALSAIRRWGRPVADLERAVSISSKVESDRLRRNVGTLRRVAALSPLIGLLGTLLMAGRVLAEQGLVATALGQSLVSLTVGVGLSIVALVAYDGLVGKVEALANTLDRFGAEVADAIAMTAPVTDVRDVQGRRGGARTPHQIRIEMPDQSRSAKRDREIELD